MTEEHLEFINNIPKEIERELKSGHDRFSKFALGDSRPGADDEFHLCPCGRFETMGGVECSAERSKKAIDRICEMVFA